MLVISHEYKLLFIHFGRTGGSYIEEKFRGDRTWDEYYKEHGYKHEPIHAEKYRYKNCWDEYFKFTIVRNPYDRACCFLKQFPFSGMYSRPFFTQNPRDVSEYDELDKIFRYENYQELCDVLNEKTDNRFRFTAQPPETYNYREYLTPQQIGVLNHKFKDYFAKFGYEMIDTKINQVF